MDTAAVGTSVGVMDTVAVGTGGTTTVFVAADGARLATVEGGMDMDIRFSGGAWTIQNMPMFVIQMQIVRWVRAAMQDFALCK